MKKILAFAVILLIAAGVQAQSIEWKALSKAQELAAEDGKKVMLFAEAEWCSYCQKMYKQVFPVQSVQDSLSKYFHPVRIDIESDKKVVLNGDEFTEQGLARKFRATRTPTTIFLDSEGGVIGAQPGFLPANVFDKLLGFVGSDLTGKKSFSKYLNEHGVDIGQ